MTVKRNALITGSTSGIGLGIARGFAAIGHNVMLNGFADREEVERLKADIASAHGVKVGYSDADVSKPEAIAAAVEQTKAELGEIDILVNNAGIQFVSPIEEFPIEKWDAIIAINLSSAFHFTRLVLPGMKERGFGRIINVASAHALVASPFKSAYVSAKHGIAGLTKTVALEAAEHGVTVNAICPGYVLTPLVQKQIPDQAHARGISEEAVVRDVLLAAQPTKRFITVEEVASLAAFLADEQTASITGAIIPIDGGWTAH
ncbi:3-hydroxybutyrate dehydrogenase [Hyphomicrobium sp.]|jgi:3-hydroxybutyrate dehydrogenase|uniref:3-hydroxybutyrate dehydrogenase n=1 Tax=Hyphomicrobium sp. TaxID=82 RepID=UPI0035659831